MSPISSGKHYVKQSPVTSYMQPQWHLAAVHDPLYGFSHNLKRGSLLFLSTIHARLDFCHLSSRCICKLGCAHTMTQLRPCSPGAADATSQDLISNQCGSLPVVQVQATGSRCSLHGCRAQKRTPDLAPSVSAEVQVKAKGATEAIMITAVLPIGEGFMRWVRCKVSEPLRSSAQSQVSSYTTGD